MDFYSWWARAFFANCQNHRTTLKKRLQKPLKLEKIQFFLQIITHQTPSTKNYLKNSNPFPTF